MTRDRKQACLVDFGAANPGAWRSIDDRVMGGLSASRLLASGAGTGVFEGVLSLDNNGGFASVRADLGPRDLSAWPGLRIRARGDGRPYRLRLHTESGTDAVAYQAFFETARDAWRETFLDFTGFEPSLRGSRPRDARPLDPSRITQVGIMTGDRRVGPFRLEIAWIRPDFPSAGLD